MFDAAHQIAVVVGAVLLAPGSLLSIWSMGAALLIAIAVVLVAHRGRAVPARVLARAMFPRRWRWGRSARTDVAFTVFGALVGGTMFSWAFLSHVVIADAVSAVIGPRAPILTGLPAVVLITVVLWLAYEFAYWFDHMLCHKVRWLWAFHKVHHSAETLSPLTIFRVHPVDTIVFYNITALATGVASGVMHAVVGQGVAPATYAGTNVILFAALMTIKHLQHSQVWLPFTGVLGRVVLSPAHHQIHHSRAPEHHDRNFGENLALFDWAFGTLHVPTAKRQALVFGVDGLSDPHSMHGALIEPFIDASAPLRQAATPATTTA